MKHSLLRYCCTAITLAALMLGTCFIPLQGGAQAQETDGPELFVTAGSTVFALATNPGLAPGPQRLVSFEANTPGTLRSDVRIQGLQMGETLKGIDFRPATGELFGLGSTSRLYRLNFTNGVATQVGSGTFTPAINGVSFFGFDFNPVPDRIRVISAVDDQSLRLNPNDGTAATDTNVVYAADDPNAGDQPNVVGAAYTNNIAGATATTLFGIDARASGGNARLVRVGGVDGPPSPNGGELRTVGAAAGSTDRSVGNLRTSTGAALETNNLVGFDITSGGDAYVSLTPINPFDAPSTFYTLDLNSRIATAVGVIGRDSTQAGGLKIEGIAVVTNAAPPQNQSTFQITTGNTTVAENVGSVNITVTRTGTTTTATSVDYTTADLTASERMDYITAAGTLFFAAGQVSQTVNILIQNDAFREGTETFNFSIFNPDGGTVATAGRTVTITITDDDTATAATNPIDERDFFVRQQYRDFLNRDPDAPGFAFWTGEYDRRVNACSTTPAGQQRIICVASARASISLAFFLSVEFQQTGYLVYRTYDVAFARVGTPRPARGQPVSAIAVTYNEFIRNTQTIARGIIVNNEVSQTALEANRQAFFRGFVQRADFTDRFPVEQSGSQFVDALFASANVAPTATERQAALTAFAGGGTEGRAAALRNVAENDQVFQREFNRAFVLMQYIGYLRRDPDIAGYNFWLNKLDGASTSTRIDPANVPNDAEAIGRVRRAEMIEAFIRSCEYQRRFGVPTTSPNDQSLASQCGS